MDPNACLQRIAEAVDDIEEMLEAIEDLFTWLEKEEDEPEWNDCPLGTQLYMERIEELTYA